MNGLVSVIRTVLSLVGIEFTADAVVSILKGAGIAAAGAVLTYMATVAIPSLQGSGQLALVAVLSVLVNAARKWLEGS